MCGIAGILTNHAELDLRDLSQRMLPALRHRGPDDQGFAEVPLPGNYRLGLMHTRLSILDLSPAGHQPMHDEPSNTWITYNGEIYNHVSVRAELGVGPYRSTCDTETILKAWGERGHESLALLRGMFAFALLDNRRQELWLVRDRLGIKPLYVYQVDAGTWLFASEVRTLLASELVPHRLDPQAVESYLAYGAVTAPWTLIQGVESVLPGEAWCFSLGTHVAEPQRTRYWQPSFAQQSVRMTYEDAVERLRPVLGQAFSRHMLSDVPVGVFLSGGIDSSAIVATLAHEGHQLNTFSVAFDEAKYDESQHARRVADMFGAKHTELRLSAATVLERMESAVSAYDQPSLDGVNTYFISQAVREAGIVVALSGLGGDELFAGYGNFRVASYLDRPLYRTAARAMLPLMRSLRPGSVRTQKLAAIFAGEGERLENYSILREVIAPHRRSELLAVWQEGGIFRLPAGLASDLMQAAEPLDPVNAWSLFELSLYMANTLLRDSDQMSMAHAVEVRVPFLDHVLVEQVAAIPGRLKLSGLRGGRQKQLLLDSLPTPLPEEIFNRPKMGFVFPWERWLRGELHDRVADTLHDEAAVQRTGLDAGAVRGLWDDFCERQPGVRASDILSLVHLVHWVQQHRVSA